MNQSITSQLSSPIENDGGDLDNQNVKNNEKISKTIHMDSTNFDEYVTNGKLNDNVTEGDTIDIQGKLDSPRFALNITKPINIISSTNDAYINLNTLSTDTTGGYKNGIFQVTKQGAGTNITGITFHHTRVSIENTSNIIINNISLINDGSIGMGVGAMTIREGSENITVINSYFKNHDCTHSLVVFAAAYNCLFENNVVEAEEVSGNLLYLTTYHLKYANPKTNINITIRNNTIRTINVPSSLAICYGLALEGKGHVIENNYIDTNFPVMAQYAEIDYGMETNIDELTFNNNIIVRGSPQLIFPGFVSNNTFGEKAILNQVRAYNNTFNNVTINNNCNFENNFAQNLVINGNNNTVSNNEVYSDDDYAVTVNGENNTLSDNKFAGYLGRGENAINNSTEIISINNSEDISRILYLDDNNWEKYFEYKKGTTPNSNSYSYPLPGLFKNNDILVINRLSETNTLIQDKYKVFSQTDTLTLINNTASFNTNCRVIAINNVILYPSSTLGAAKSQAVSIINSTLSNAFITDETEIIDSILMKINNKAAYPKDNVYISHSTLDFFEYNGTSKDTLKDSSEILLIFFRRDRAYAGTYTTPFNEIFVDCNVNIRPLVNKNTLKTDTYFDNSGGTDLMKRLFGSIEPDTYFIGGSQASTINGITFYGKVQVNDSYIQFTNCTFNGDVEVNKDYSSFEGCFFNGSLTLNSANGLLFKDNIVNSNYPLMVTTSRLMDIENNIINITGDKTIVFDDESNRNNIKNNQLISNSLLGDDSVVGGDNIVENNGIAYSTNISISCDDVLLAGDKSNVTVTVYNTYNDTPVDTGYVEVYLDGILQGIKQLVNGQVTLEVNTDKSSLGAVPLKVWYYDGIRYANNVTSINVDVVKSNVLITCDDFIAKLNEQASTNITFLNQKGNPVHDTNITVTVGRTTYTIETTGGVATLNELVTTEWLDSGSMTITFSDTEKYNRNFTTITLNTSKADVLVTPEVTVDGNIVNIKLTYTDNLKQNVIDGKVSITTLDGTQLANGKVSNGVYTTTVTIPEGYTKDYLIANYTGSYYYNDFERQVKLSLILNSSVTINTNSPVLGEELNITGKLTDSNGESITGAPLEIIVNGEKSTITTDGNGEYNYTMTPSLGENTITVTFDGNIDYYGTSNNATVEVLNVSRDIKDLMDQIEALQKENDELKDENTNLSNELNNANDNIDTLTKANDNLNKQLTDTNNKLNALNSTNKNLAQQLDNANNNIDALTKANDNLNKQLTDTNNKLNNLNNTNKNLAQQLDNANAKIDSLTKSNNDLSKQLADTNKKLDDLSKSVDSLNKQLADSQKQINDLNKAVNDKDNTIKELTSKKNTKVSVNKINATKYGNDVVITGTLTDNGGVALANMPVSVKINNAESKVVTNNKGVYSLTKATTVVGTNNVSVSFAGDSKYNSVSSKTTFKVNKQDLKITINSIKQVRFKDNVTITGTLTDAKGKVIGGTTLNLSINGKTVKVKTGKDGLFTYTRIANAMGTNNVTVSYAGNAKYNKATVKATFKVTKQALVLTVDRVFSSIRYKDDMEISGKLVDGNNKAIGNTQITIKVNNKTYKAKTNKNGVYVLKIRATNIGTNNVTATYAGNTKYNKATAKTTFKVAKQDLIIGFDSVTYSNGKITVKGTFTDRNRHALMNSVARITINGKTGTSKTNNKGTFTYTTKGKQGVLKLTLAYPGNVNYNAYNKTSTINV